MKLNYSIIRLTEAARELIKAAGAKNIWTFEGEMGSGKTTLIKAVCKELGVEHEVSSPTFSLVNEYHTQSGQVIYHFDFYRIKGIEEVYDIGYEDYLYSGNLCLMEWPEKISDLLKGEDVCGIRIEKVSEEERRIIV